MPPATARRPHARSDRRLGIGIAVSVLLHGVLLSLQFGVPGIDMGGGAPLAVRLAEPPSAPVATPEPLRSVELAPTPVPPSVPVPVPAPAPVTGMRLVDLPPAPIATPPAAAAPAPAAKRPARRPRLRRPAPPVIAIAPDPASEFAVALPEIAPDPTPEIGETVAPAREDEEPNEALRLVQVEQEALALAEQETQKQAVQEASRQAAAEAARLAEAQLETDRLAMQARIDDAQRQAQEQLERERSERAALDGRRQQEQVDLASERDAQAEAARRIEQEAAERDLAERLREKEEAARLAQEQRQREQLERQRQQAQEAQQRLAREQHEVQQQLERERLAREAERARSEEAARQQRLAQEAARREAEVLAEVQAQATARAAAERLAAERATPGDGLGPGSGGAAGMGGAARTGSPGGLPGSRAAELLRGLRIPDASVPVAAREASNARRVLADGGERDAPLRLYVDSVRQKLERNAVLAGARLSLREVRIDPLVSVALRSDGSVDDVTIVRSSGRGDVDDAVRRFVQLNARYAAFPPNVAARFDVIEIRRIWRFSEGLKLVEEMR